LLAKRGKRDARWRRSSRKCWRAAEGILRIGERHDDRFRYWQWRTEKGRRAESVIILKSLKDAGREVERNSGASLIDLAMA